MALPNSPHLNGTTPIAALKSIRDNQSYQSVNVLNNHAPDMILDSDHKTSFSQTFIHLLKGNIGCGVLSLPWAISQLGFVGGVISIITVAFWSSYNCWTIVKLKRYMERTCPVQPAPDDAASEAPSSAYSSANTNITYPDVGDWAYGKQFQNYVAACVCVQQLAICTVFFSFIGENVLALARWCDFQFTHTMVLSIALPAVLSLSFLPNLKSLAPIMAAGTILMLVGFGSLGVIGGLEWSSRPEELPKIQVARMPLALCAILYSYEGICLVLPVESAMREPQQFQKAFTLAMATVSIILALVSSLSVMAFGNVTNGSVTAYLLQAYQNDPSVTLWLMLANSAVSLSVLLTYPLQLFPALEICGPWLQERGDGWPCLRGKGMVEEEDLAGFDPLPSLPEHDTASLGSLPSQHDYGDWNADDAERLMTREGEDDDEEDNFSRGMSSVRSMFPELTMPGDSPQLRVLLVVLTYFIAVAVPNVQSLISLAGAVAGSSTALLIPPFLELAWISHLQRDSNKEELDALDEKRWFIAHGSDKFIWEKVKSWTLLFLGCVFTAIGSIASVVDIISSYRK